MFFEFFFGILLIIIYNFVILIIIIVFIDLYKILSIMLSFLYVNDLFLYKILMSIVIVFNFLYMKKYCLEVSFLIFNYMFIVCGVNV